jgi:spore germination protein
MTGSRAVPAAGHHRRPGSHRGPRRRSPLRLALVLGSTAALLAAALTLFPHSTPAARAATVVASLPYWSFSNGTGTVLSHSSDFSEASPWIYGLGSDGQIEVQYPPSMPQVMADIGRLRAAGLPIVPTIANTTGGNWAYQPIARILHDPVLMKRHIASIVTLADQEKYAGIDIDYEGLHAGDRQAFSTFVSQLAAALHAHGKILSVAVFAKTTGAGYGGQNVAQDYRVIGRAADQVRLMAYDYHWGTSPPGPIAPVSWVRAVLGYARTQIPASKIVLGIPLYGYDWVGDHGTDLTWQQAVQLAAAHRVPVHYDSSSQSPWFTYTDSSGRAHQVWFENPESSAAKFAIAKDMGIGGMFLWMYGNEAPGTWPELHRYLPSGTQPTASTTGRS